MNEYKANNRKNSYSTDGCTQSVGSFFRIQFINRQQIFHLYGSKGRYTRFLFRQDLAIHNIGLNFVLQLKACFQVTINKIGLCRPWMPSYSAIIEMCRQLAVTSTLRH